MKRLSLALALAACLAQAQFHLPGSSGGSTSTPAKPKPPASVQPAATTPAPGPDPHFDYYVLALAADKLYVMGLRPTALQGPSPEACGTKHATKGAISLALPVMLNEAAARKEWDLHGTCTGLAPADYFSDVRLARSLIQLPVQLTALENAATEGPANIEAWFTAANPSFPAGAFQVACQEKKPAAIHACFDLQLHPRPCPPASASQSCN
jgi:ribonuclease T2